MPLNSNQTTMLFYGTNTPDKIIPVNTLNAREPFINTYNSYNVSTVSLVSGGTGYLESDVGKICTVNLTGGTQVRPMSVIINSVTAGSIGSVSLIDYGSWTNPPTIFTGALIFPVSQPSPGVGAGVTTTFARYPTIEAYATYPTPNGVGGGGLFVGDATSGRSEYVRITGSLAPQDYNNVNITGGSVSNITLNAVNIISSVAAPTTITQARLVRPAITGGTINPDTTVVPTVATAINSAVITGGTVDLSTSGNLKVKNQQFPVGVTGVGVLVLGSDGNVYVTTNLDAATVNTLQTASYVKVNGGLAVGSAINTSTLGSGAIRVTNDIVAKATS